MIPVGHVVSVIGDCHIRAAFLHRQ